LGTSGTSGAASGSGGSPCTPGGSVKTTFHVYEVTGNWPELQPCIATKAPTQPWVYKKITVGGSLGTQFLAESCSIADYNNDGIPDVSAGRRWYEGTNDPATTFQTAHIFRGTPFTTPGHGQLPRLGTDTGCPTNPICELNNGVSDDWADWPWDVNGDGFADIINMASSEMNTVNSPEPRPQANASIYWYENPKTFSATGADQWTPHLINSDMRLEHHNLCDYNGDGIPEITGANRGQNQTKGVYTLAGAYYPVTRSYIFPFIGGTGWMHGLGCGDVDGDGKPDLIERSGIWLQPATGAWATPAPAETCNNYACGPWQWVPQTLSGSNGQQSPNLGNAGNDGSATMFVYDVDGDGLNDIIGSDWAHGIGLSWYQQTTPVAQCIGKPSSLTAGGPPGGTLANCFTRHVIMGSTADANSPKVGGTAVIQTENHSAQLMDMDGDGLKDIVTGKEWLAHPFDQGDPSPKDPPYLVIWKLVRDVPGAPGKPGMAHFEGHMIDSTCNATCWGVDGTGKSTGLGPGGTTSTTPCCVGVGRQITVGHANLDGIPDICASTKLGLYVFLGQ
jgi:hypothetical protein